jgi:hypothetical protein
MTLYKLQVFDSEKNLLQEFIQGEKFQFSEMIQIENCVILVINYPKWGGGMPSNSMQGKLVRTIKEKTGKEALILNFPEAVQARFLRVNKVGTSKDSKSLYSRKLRLGRKRGNKDTKETDAKEGKKEEKVQEEETSTGDEEGASWRTWAY